MTIQLVVEGHGEVKAFPVLLRRLRDAAQAWELDFGHPVRRKCSDLNSKGKFQDGVRIALSKEDCSAILVLFDLDDGCPKTASPQLTGWASEAARHVPCQVVLARPEYEAWFLASAESLRGTRGVREDASFSAEPENRRDAKGALEDLMEPGRFYLETSDQAAFSAVFDMQVAYRRSRSFRKLVGAFGKLAKQLGCTIQEWPPRSWAGEPAD